MQYTSVISYQVTVISIIFCTRYRASSLVHNMETPRAENNSFPRQTDAAFSKDLTFARLCDLKFPLEIKVYVSWRFRSDV